MLRGSDRRRRQKRRGGDEEIAAPAPPTAPARAPAFEVESCELIEVGGGDALLRLSGRWAPAAPERLDLVCFGDGAIERIEPLPPGPSVAADGLWHVAFCVAETATGAHLALMTAAGVAIGVPTPTRLHSAPIEPSAHERELAVERDARAEAEQLAHDATAATARAAREILEERRRTDEATRRAEVAERKLAAQTTSAQGVVENDLRHLLEKRERELEAVRAELAEQRTRYAAAASAVPPAEEPPADAIAGAKAEPWSRVDEDLLERLARAKSLAGQD